MRPVSWVVGEEIRSGDLGIGGNPVTTADVKAPVAGAADTKRGESDQGGG